MYVSCTQEKDIKRNGRKEKEKEGRREGGRKQRRKKEPSSLIVKLLKIMTE